MLEVNMILEGIGLQDNTLSFPVSDDTVDARK